MTEQLQVTLPPRTLALLDQFQQEVGFVALNLGCGSVRIPGFIGVDLEPACNPDLVVDLTRGLPDIPDASVDLIYSEHAWEPRAKRVAGLVVRSGIGLSTHNSLTRECFRVLRPGGRIRIATPDLDYIVFKYLWDWRNQAWLDQEPWSSEIKTRCQAFNRAVRQWDLQFIFNEEDLRALLEGAGFELVTRFEHGASADKRLWNLETRIDSTLILEGVKA